MKSLTATPAEVALIAVQLIPHLDRRVPEADYVYRARLIREARLLLEEAERQDREPMKVPA